MNVWSNFLVPLLVAGLIPTGWLQPCETQAAPQPRTGAEQSPKDRSPTGQELKAAIKAYSDLGGSYRMDTEYNGKVVHRFVTPYPATADMLSRLPDISFPYQLDLILGERTPAGSIKMLARLQNLRRVFIALDVGAERVDPTARIAELAGAPNLEEVQLDDELLTDALAGELASFPTLRVLLGAGPLSDAGVAKLSSNAKLESIAVSPCPGLTDAALRHFAGMQKLRVLGLQDSAKVTAVGIRHLAKHVGLVELAVGGSGMKEDALAEIENIKSLERLNLLAFTSTAVTERGLQHIALLPRLRQLVLPKGVRHTDTGLKKLAASPALEEVNLTSCGEVTDAGAKELVRLSKLKDLRLQGARQLTDESMKELGQLGQLTHFELEGAPRVTDSGIRALLTARGKTLKSLSLSGLSISEELVDALPKLAPALDSLNLYACREITDRSVPSFAKMVSLQKLSLHGTAISPHGIKILQQKLPQCRVDGRSGQPK